MKKYLSLFSAVITAIICLSVSVYAYADATVIGDDNAYVTVSSVSSYDANAKTPPVLVICNGVTLTQNVDYTLTYTDNVNAGTGHVTVNGIGAYSGSVTRDFTISQNDITNNSAVSVSLSSSSFKYNATEIKPTVSVLFNGTALAENTDYTLTYSNNIDAGTAKVTVNGIGNFCGSIEKTYKITALSLTESGKTTVTFEKSSLVYNGSAVIPIMYVSYDKGGDIGNQYLIQDVDYTVTYSKNNAPGKASVKISGIGNYSGSITKSFTISPAKVSNLKIKKLSASSVSLSWSAVSKVSGYEIMSYSSSKKKYVHLAYVTSKNTSYKIKSLKNGKAYSYKVRAYKTVSKKKYYGEYSDVVGTFIKPSTVRISSVTLDGTTLTVEWGKVNCSGYEIFYTTDSKFKKNIKTVKVKSSKKSSRKIKNLKKGKNYYVKVRAYTVYNGKTYNGDKSTLLSSYFSNVYASYYSYYENNANRTTNLRLASKEISGTIIQPGETFDFNEVVGTRTAAKGYKSAHVFAGEQVVAGIGGGICQVASTMFNTALKANLEITERHQHDQRVSYVPLGRDAAISGTAQNFKWKNNTKYAIKIEMTVSGGKISCTFYTCQKAKPKKVTLNVSQSGNNFTLTRKVDGTVNYKAYSNY